MGEVMNERGDIELLDAYASERSEEAFRELVARHVDFVYSAALRQLRNPHLAQEATQAAFVALAGKAGQLGQQTIVAGWLHRAAHFAALNLQRAEARRKRREEEAATMNVPDADGPLFQELVQPHVDGALAELDESDRDAVILRFLQDRSLREVAETLGTSEEAAKKRVSRALERLRGLLARRGVAVPVAVLAVGLSQLPVTAAPAALPSTLTALAMHTAVPAATASSTVATLMTSAQAKLALVTALILGGSALLWWQTRPGPVASNPAQNANQRPASTMRIKLTSVLVNDQAKALKFYTEVLGFVKKTDVPAGGARWLTVVSPQEPDGPELLLEPMGFAPAKTYQAALHSAGIPLTAFAVGDILKEHERLTKLGVVFSMPPTAAGPTTMAVLDDTCGNRIQLFQPATANASAGAPGVKLRLTSVMVQDQAKALKFYTEVLGFVKKRDFPAGEGRWLTVVSPRDPDGMELVLEPIGFAPAKTFQAALHKAGIPLTSFAVDDVKQEHTRLAKLGVVFHMQPTLAGPVTIATLDDTCGNLIQIAQAPK